MSRYSFQFRCKNSKDLRGGANELLRGFLLFMGSNMIKHVNVMDQLRWKIPKAPAHPGTYVSFRSTLCLC